VYYLAHDVRWKAHDAHYLVHGVRWKAHDVHTFGCCANQLCALDASSHGALHWDDGLGMRHGVHTPEHRGGVAAGGAVVAVADSVAHGCLAVDSEAAERDVPDIVVDVVGTVDAEK
jgi:hypothetical protein